MIDELQVWCECEHCCILRDGSAAPIARSKVRVSKPAMHGYSHVGGLFNRVIEAARRCPHGPEGSLEIHVTDATQRRGTGFRLIKGVEHVVSFA